MRILQFSPILLLLCCALFLSAQDDTQPNELIFSHQKHSVELEMECLTCHGAAEESITGEDNLLPVMETCGACHDVEDGEQCGMCHSDLDEPRAVNRIQTYSAKFNHQKHIEAGLNCMSCHGGILKRTAVGMPENLPDMVTCMDCHETMGASNDCNTCHLPEENLKPASHTINFAHAHGDMARNDQRSISGGFSCTTCHSDNYCQDCHEGDNLDRTTHPLNFEFTHALVAKGKETECASCHTDREFCIACHRDNQVMPHNHTAGWALRNIGGRHKDEAINDIENCMVCHEYNAEQVCQPCHSK